MSGVSRYFFGTIDCIIILPLTLLVAGVIAYMPPADIIKVASYLQKITSLIPQTTERKNQMYERWVKALARLRRFLKIKLTCLGEVIVLRTMLRVSGVQGEIKIGIRRSGQPDAAHAWLEIPGVETNVDLPTEYIEFSLQPFHS